MMAHVFPPQLVPLLRDQLGSGSGRLNDIGDEFLVEILTTVFFAGLETYEGEHNPIRVVFIGERHNNVVVPTGTDAATAPVYQWKLRRFVNPRPFTIPELVKLAAVCAADWTYSVVHYLPDRGLVLAGLAREGFPSENDPFIEVIAPKPGCLSIRSGRENLIEYERGAASTPVGDAVLSVRPIRQTLELAASAANLQDLEIEDYLAAVQRLVRNMAAHGKGGILIISAEECPVVAESERYRMDEVSSLTSLMRLSRRIADRPSERGSFRQILRDAFEREIERIIQELAAVTRIDGATLLSRDLTLIAFGVILPVDGPPTVIEATPGSAKGEPVDLGVWGTRHRAAATFAAEHPNSTVFVASEDGHVRCMLREPSRSPVLLWHLGSSDIPEDEIGTS